jgi:hypothetical protein
MAVWFNQYIAILANLKKANNSKTIDFYKNKAEDFLNKALLEYQLYLLSEADKLVAKDDLTCYHKFSCLVKK